MEDFVKYLQKVSDGLRTLSEDIARIIIEKKKKAEEAEKQQAGKKTEKKTENLIGTAQDKKEKASEEFKKISLKSLQPVTKIYKKKEDIEKAKEEPEIDFINKQLEEIFK